MASERSQPVPRRAGHRCAAALGAVTLLSWPQPAAAQSETAERGEATGQTTRRPPLLVRDRHVSLTVADLQRAATAVVQIARKLHGELSEQGEPYVVVRIPAAQLDEALARLQKVGALRSRSASTRDVTQESASLDPQLRSLLSARERLLSLQRGAQSVSDSLLVERKLSQIEQQIARLQAARVALERQTTLVTLRVSLEPLEDVSPDAIPELRLPFAWLQELSLSELLDTTREEPPDEPEPARQIEANLDLALQLEGLMIVDRPEADDTQYAVVAAMRSRGVAGTDPVGMGLGLDLVLGGGQGFVYDLGLLLGLGASIGEYSSLGLLGGVGVGGWTGDRIPSSLELPVELFVTAEFGEVARLLLFAQPRWTPTSHTRQDGSEHAWIFDELSVGGALLLPPAVGNDELEDGGLRLGFVYHELVDTRMYAITAGLGFGLVDH